MNVYFSLQGHLRRKVQVWKPGEWRLLQWRFQIGGRRLLPPAAPFAAIPTDQHERPRNENDGRIPEFMTTVISHRPVSRDSNENSFKTDLFVIWLIADTSAPFNCTLITCYSTGVEICENAAAWINPKALHEEIRKLLIWYFRCRILHACGLLGTKTTRGLFFFGGGSIYQVSSSSNCYKV